jgi:assimilatory nitrate reductase catalytic subunit
LLSRERIGDADRALLLSGRGGAGAFDEGELVCACFGVGRKRIGAEIVSRGLGTVEAVGAHLKAGTNCGSCRPEIRALIETHFARSAA